MRAAGVGTEALHVAAGSILLLLAWAGLRASVGAGRRPWRAALLDLLPVVAGFALLLAGTGRPVLSALAIAAAAGGLVLTDRVKRAVLREPVVFADRAELLEVLRHPRLYLPFAGTGRVLAGAAGAVLAVAGLAWLEPPLFPAHPLAWPVLALLGWAGFALPARAATRLAHRYEGWDVTRDPARDMARFGMLATFVIHATIARAERAGRRALARPAALPTLPRSGTIVLVQSESLFDVGRLHPALRGRLPHLDQLRSEAALHGRLSVPAWGANTVRSEFAVLSGLDEATLGLDRFNPYAHFARSPLASVVWQARLAGWRTVCVHPFALSFYGRNRVLPQLGFAELIGPEAFDGAERGGEWVSDRALGEVVARLLGENNRPSFVFAITMECHGPWDRQTGDPLPPELAKLPSEAELGRYLARLRGADAIVPVLTAALRRRAGPGWLALYGDHQPSLPATFDALGLDDPRTDYVIWGTRAATGENRDLAAHELGTALAELAR